MKRLFLLLFTCLLLSSCGGNDKLQWEYCVVQLEGSQTPRVYAACEAEALKKASVYKPLYLPETDDLMMILNNCGQDGWELVGIYTTTETVFPNMGDEQYHTGIKENTRTQSIVLPNFKPVGCDFKSRISRQCEPDSSFGVKYLGARCP